MANEDVPVTALRRATPGAAQRRRARRKTSCPSQRPSSPGRARRAWRGCVRAPLTKGCAGRRCTGAGRGSRLRFPLLRKKPPTHGEFVCDFFAPLGSHMVTHMRRDHVAKFVRDDPSHNVV